MKKGSDFSEPCALPAGLEPDMNQTFFYEGKIAQFDCATGNEINFLVK